MNISAQKKREFRFLAWFGKNRGRCATEKLFAPIRWDTARRSNTVMALWPCWQRDKPFVYGWRIPIIWPSRRPIDGGGNRGDGNGLVARLVNPAGSLILGANARCPSGHREVASGRRLAPVSTSAPGTTRPNSPCAPLGRGWRGRPGHGPAGRRARTTGDCDRGMRQCGLVGNPGFALGAP